jgi:pyruvate/2-oxoacid:ferredoxin oxidoreductase alpha subunit
MTFAGKMQAIIDKGVRGSGELARKARGKAKDLGAMGVLKVEIVQLQSEAGKIIAKLGNEVYRTLVEKDQAAVSRETPSIRTFLKKIEELRGRIDLKEKEYHVISARKKP